MPQRLGQRVEYGAHPRRVAAAERPGSLLVDIAVGLADDPPDRLQRQMKSLLRDMPAHCPEEVLRSVHQYRVASVQLARIRHAATAIAVDHHQHALRKIAEIIGEIAVEPANDGAVRKIAVAAER